MECGQHQYLLPLTFSIASLSLPPSAGPPSPSSEAEPLRSSSFELVREGIVPPLTSQERGDCNGDEAKGDRNGEFKREGEVIFEECTPHTKPPVHGTGAVKYGLKQFSAPPPPRLDSLFCQAMRTANSRRSSHLALPRLGPAAHYGAFLSKLCSATATGLSVRQKNECLSLKPTLVPASVMYIPQPSI